MEAHEKPTEAQETSDLRRNPKRKASEATGPSLDLPDDLLGAAYEPLKDSEREDFEGWVELESDPVSFTYILKELGVQGVQVQELFSLDQDSLDQLPKPVYGLVFLYQYQPEQVEESEEDLTDEVWFANQTSHNACATVALFNIMMNAETLDLGEELHNFKIDTLSLAPPLRGDRITTNKFIRSKHNSFASRMDLLNADLALENEVDTANRANKRRANTKKGGKKSAQRGHDYAFHFIAYVAAGGAVWELDGLRSQPHRLGPVDPEDWTNVARPQIEARIMQYAESQLSFNLLALCQNALASHRQQILEALAAMRHIRATMRSVPEFDSLISGEDAPINVGDHAQLARFGLTIAAIEQVSPPQNIKSKMSNPSLQVNDTYELYHSLVLQIKIAMSAYAAEVEAGEEGHELIRTLKSSWSPAIHKWVTALADRGALTDIIRNSQDKGV